MKFKRNPDEAKAKKIQDAVKANDGFCPCKIEHKEENRCPCDEFLFSEKLGWCNCGLYYKEEI